MTPVLVLNQNYEPLQIAALRRAIVLVGRGKAEVIEHGALPIRTVRAIIPRPSIIRLVAYVRRPRPRVRFSRREVFRRDEYTCQYCGKRARELTLDHVIPRHRGGRDTWENIVTACRPCNGRKGGRTPEEARMPLRRLPREPKATTARLFTPYPERDDGWAKFIEV